MWLLFEHRNRSEGSVRQVIQKKSRNHPKDSVKALRGMLGHVEMGSVELQHEVSKIRASRYKPSAPSSDEPDIHLNKTH